MGYTLEMSTRPFFFLAPLSNWLLAYDRYARSWDKTRIPGNRFPHDTYVLDVNDEKGLATVLDKTQALIDRLGVPGDRIVRVGVQLPLDGKVKVEPNTTTGTGVGWRWPSTVVPVHDLAVWNGNTFVEMHSEGITAMAFALKQDNLKNWEDCQPRSFSVLPIAQACNARCAFCFSKASVSDSILPSRLNIEQIRYWAGRAQDKGAKRAVITGGGEPTLLRHNLMLELMASLRDYFPYTLMISNGSIIQQWASKDIRVAIKKTKEWKQAGLSRLAISRHGVDLDADARIMGLAVNTPLVIDAAQQAGIPVRLICVLQKGGVETFFDVRSYLERAANDGANEVCFKELYVSSLSENPWARSKENLYCQDNQVPLSMLIDALMELGFEQTGALPWGSPYFEGSIGGKRLRVAAYTEPSVGWERSHGIVRSWNLMSDGACLASLEDPHSILRNT